MSNITLDTANITPTAAAGTSSDSPSTALLRDLQQRLAACIQNGVLTAPAQTMASSAVADLLAAFGGGGNNGGGDGVGHGLVLAAPRLVLTDDGLSISGEFSPVPGYALAAIARFYVEEGRLQMALQARLAPGQVLGIRQLVQQFLPGTALPSDLPELGLVAMALCSSPLSATFSFGSGQSGWTVPIGPVGLGIGDVTLQLARSNGAEGEPPRTLATLGGSMALGGADFTLAYTPPGALVLGAHTPSVPLRGLVDGLCGAGTLGRLPLPPALADLQLPAVSAQLDVADKRFSLAAEGGLFSAVGLAVGRDKAGAWGFTAGFKPVDDLRLSDLDPSLAALDGLVLDELAVVVSSVADGSLPLPDGLAGHVGLDVVRGVNLLAALDLRGLGADKLLGLDTVAVKAAIGGTLDSVVLEAKLGGHLKLSDQVEFRDLAFRLRPAPQAFEVSVLGRLGVDLQGSALVFTGAMSVTPTGASFAATMAGDWVEPFGARGVAINGLAVELGIAFSSGFPIVGLAGAMTLGSAQGSAAVRVDSGNPALSMVAVDFDTLHLGEVIGQLCDATVRDQIPADAARSILDINFHQAELAVVPQRTHIGEIVYEPGLHIAADITAWGLQAAGKLSLDYTSGIELDARMDPITVGDAFRLTGANGERRPQLRLAVGPSAPPALRVSGEVTLLGMGAETDITLNDHGFSFEVEGRLLNLFEARVLARGGRFEGEDGFLVSATMKNDLLAVLRQHATQAIADATRQASQGISTAQRDVDAAQAEVNRLNGQIANQRRIVQAERAQSQRGIDAASAKVAAAQTTVNGLQGQINALNRWYYRLPKVAVPWKDSQASRAIDFAARQGALYAALGTARTALAAAQGVLDLARKAAGTVPVDADPRVAGLIVGLHGATAALKVATGVLLAARSTSVGVLQAADFIARAGLGGVVDVRAAQFEASLAIAKGGRVLLHAEVDYLGQPQRVQWQVNLADPVAAGRDLAQRLLGV